MSITPLLKRELKEFYIREPFSTIVSFGILSFVFTLFIPQIAAIQIPFVRILLIFITPIAIMMLFSSPLLYREFYRDIIEKKIEVLLGIGLTNIQIWLAKVTAICMVLYALFITGFICANIISIFTDNGALWSAGLSGLEWVIFLFLSPLTGLCIVAFIGFLFLVIKKVVVVTYIPMILFFVVAFIIKRLKLVANEPKFWIDLKVGVIFFLIVSIISIIVPIIFLKLWKNERIIG